jgi:hypothetical protein
MLRRRPEGLWRGYPSDGRGGKSESEQMVVRSDDGRLHEEYGYVDAPRNGRVYKGTVQ